ncbi:thiamine phosphate synthase [Novosphingobium bradum]|uniref:Thiamine phosphate synthase n=1 Tax=Novosphingobium bradum TaxID=1737444 RepID=A0ABV7IQJ7_9SPHN
MWLVSDARNDAGLEAALARLPRGSGLVFRHYHLPPAQRVARFRALARAARGRGVAMAWAGSVREARAVGADACYGPAELLARGPGLARLVTAHSLAEIGKGRQARASALLLSPVFPTRSHPGAPGLGAVRFRLLAARSPVPVLALGGMDARRARALRAWGWAAIDGLASSFRA